MSRRARYTQGLSKAFYAIALMVLGAQGLAQYLVFTRPGLAGGLKDIQSGLSLVFWIFVVAGASLDPRKTGADVREPSPRRSGVAVVVVTGVAASVMLARSNPAYGLLIAIGTLIVAAAVWRFATTHAGDIGEARFKTDVARG
jgi:hypothetical protein